MSQLLAYIHFVGSTSIEEEMLFCKLLEKTTTANDVFEVVFSYFDHNLIEWKNLVRVRTDGAPEMLGSLSGFVARIKQRIPNAVGTHSVVHREAVASRTLPASMNDKLAIAICIVNFVNSNSVKLRPFTVLYKDVDADHQTLLHGFLMVIKRQYASLNLRAERGSGATPRSSRESGFSAFIYSR